MWLRCFAKKRGRERKRELDQTRFSSFNDLVFDPWVLLPAPFRSLKYSIGTMAKIQTDMKFRFIDNIYPNGEKSNKSKAKRLK